MPFDFPPESTFTFTGIPNDGFFSSFILPKGRSACLTEDSLVFRCLSDGPHSGLAEVLALALVRVELFVNAGLLILAEGNQGRSKLHVAVLAYTQQGRTSDFSHNPQFPLWHGDILRR